jgi:hypothetical protein
MNEEYLWSKAGHDPEVERLEALLTVFRSTKTDSASIPVKNREPERGSWMPGLRFALGFGAFAAVAFAILGIFLQMSEQTMRIAAGSVEKSYEIAVVEKDDVAGFEAPIQKRPAKVYDDPRSKPIVRRPAKAVPGTEARSRPPELTAEEREAYDRLILALSFTGSKLKIVKDKVNGSDK